ncbi:hypothetical protein AYI70_g5916 [Smittium culicis]|uniref:Uncharacterized protein n=1 Tax=Smittium culicis TaxID=133412 RepID=A0A1R1XSA5_9FUNG|nr:hypothetical protein AYI70_g5916 [Smittium culicis]
MLFGFQMRTPSSWGAPIEEYGYEQAESRIDRMVKVKNQEKIRYDRDVIPKEFAVGESVYKSIEHVQKKLDPKWEGPYKIDKILQKGTYWISDRIGNKDLVHGDRLKKFREGNNQATEILAPLRSNLGRKLREYEDINANRGRLELKGGDLSYNNLQE